MKLDFEKMGGLIPAVVQDADTQAVLMVGFMNPAAWEKTVETGCVTFYSRTRDKLWTKGETSGHVLKVQEVLTDCDLDTVVVRATPVGPGVCHEYPRPERYFPRGSAPASACRVSCRHTNAGSPLSTKWALQAAVMLALRSSSPGVREPVCRGGPPVLVPPGRSGRAGPSPGKPRVGSHLCFLCLARA